MNRDFSKVLFKFLQRYLTESLYCNLLLCLPLKSSVKDTLLLSVAVFLIGHFCIPGWLEPLLDRIARAPTTVPTPEIDLIMDDTLGYRYGSGPEAVGGFDWNLQVRMPCLFVCAVCKMNSLKHCNSL